MYVQAPSQLSILREVNRDHSLRSVLETVPDTRPLSCWKGGDEGGGYLVVNVPVTEAGLLLAVTDRVHRCNRLSKWLPRDFEYVTDRRHVYCRPVNRRWCFYGTASLFILYFVNITTFKNAMDECYVYIRAVLLAKQLFYYEQSNFKVRLQLRANLKNKA